MVNRRHQVVQLMLGRQVVVDFSFGGCWPVLTFSCTLYRHNRLCACGLMGVGLYKRDCAYCVRHGRRQGLQQIAGMIARGAFECG